MTTGIRDLLRTRLRERMVARDKPAVEVLRIALARIENAEAQPLDTAATTAGDVPRRLVTDDDARTLVATEITELIAEAEEYRSVGQTDAATTLDAQADVLRAALAAYDAG